MNKKSKIKFSDLSSKINNPEIKPLSDAETTKVVGGCWCPPGRPIYSNDR